MFLIVTRPKLLQLFYCNYISSSEEDRLTSEDMTDIIALVVIVKSCITYVP